MLLVLFRVTKKVSQLRDDVTELQRSTRNASVAIAEQSQRSEGLHTAHEDTKEKVAELRESFRTYTGRVWRWIRAAAHGCGSVADVS